MKNLYFLFCFLPIFSLAQVTIPHLETNEFGTHLMVHRKPYIVLGGELSNSTATTMQNMKPVWPKLKALNLNTVLIPVYWELIESKEGVYDFGLYKNLILECRKQNLKIVFLWFGAWKNSMSSHVPAWIKLNQEKYPRSKDQNGKSQEILSAFSENVFTADKRAFEHLMSFIKNADQLNQTVIMVQVENEIGMLPSARDHQELADRAFHDSVPKELIDYLQSKREKLVPELYHLWKTNGFKSTGTWEELFGKGLHTDEIFMAYYYSKFANRLTAAGKKIHPIPMFVNAALNRPGREPGQYPSAGPLPHLMDVWKASGKDIDLLTPDFYNPDFTYWCDLYTIQGDPLLVPEHVFDNTVAAKALYSIAHYNSLGFSPFSIESKSKPEDEPLSKMFLMIHNLTSILFTNPKDGILLSKKEQEYVLKIGKYEFTCKHDYTLSWTPGARTEDWPLAAAAIIQTKENEFFIAGTGVVITFKNNENPDLHTGILKAEEGQFENGKWKVMRHLNGDQTHQGRHVNIPTQQIAIQRVELYNYK